MFDPYDVDDVPLDVHAKNVPGVLSDFGLVIGNLDATGFTSAAHLDLRFNDDRVARRSGDLHCLVNVLSDATGAYGDAETGEVLLSLIFE
jgi:hypothetical protein